MKRSGRRPPKKEGKHPDTQTLISKRMYVIVNGKHKPVTHRLGCLLVFYKRSSAKKWLEYNQATVPDDWRIEPLSLELTRN